MAALPLLFLIVGSFIALGLSAATSWGLAVREFKHWDHSRSPKQLPPLQLDTDPLDEQVKVWALYYEEGLNDGLDFENAERWADKRYAKAFRTSSTRA